MAKAKGNVKSTNAKAKAAANTKAANVKATKVDAVTTAIQKHFSAPIMLNGIDVTPPTHLIREGGPRLTHEQARNLINPRARDWAPIRPESEWTKRPSLISLTANYIANPEFPVSVQVSLSDKAGSTALAAYTNWADFNAKHDAKSYPIKRVAELEGTTVVIVSAKPWAGKERKPSTPRTGKSKAEIIGEMLLSPNGCTSQEVKDAMGWPSVSMPAQAKLVGLTLRKEKVDGVLRYFGSKDQRVQQDLVQKITGAFKSKKDVK